MAERFEDLRVWQTARELTQQVYDVTNDGPFESDWALKDQIRRAAISVMSKIAPQEYVLRRHYEIVRRLLYRLHRGTSR